MSSTSVAFAGGLPLSNDFILSSKQIDLYLFVNKQWQLLSLIAKCLNLWVKDFEQSATTFQINAFIFNGTCVVVVVVIIFASS